MSAYNSANTIEKAITSVLNQTYTNLELIVVDDCSQDNTIDIVNIFSDSRIRLIRHQENKGAGYARNTGIRNITGEYTAFLDSDDYYDSDYIYTLISASKKYDADIVSSGFNCIDKGITNKLSYPFKVLDGEDKWEVPEKGDMLHKTPVLRFLNTCLVKSTLWNNVDYCTRRYIEDTPTLYRLLYFANRRVIIPDAKYNYVQLENSLIHSSSYNKDTIYRCLALRDIFEFNIEHNVPCQGILVQVIRELKSLSKECSIEYSSELSELLFFILNNLNIK